MNHYNLPQDQEEFEALPNNAQEMYRELCHWINVRKLCISWPGEKAHVQKLATAFGIRIDWKKRKLY